MYFLNIKRIYLIKICLIFLVFFGSQRDAIFPAGHCVDLLPMQKQIKTFFTVSLAVWACSDYKRPQSALNRPFLLQKFIKI